jgi:hypothetical protein
VLSGDGSTQAEGGRAAGHHGQLPCQSPAQGGDHVVVGSGLHDEIGDTSPQQEALGKARRLPLVAGVEPSARGLCVDFRFRREPPPQLSGITLGCHNEGIIAGRGTFVKFCR